jgi:NAD(P)-dependent dehydrogenase (short-subunit alcohol dehydrogenase family)
MAVVIITGTSTGIGFATAVALGRAGHEVFATMRHPERSPALQTLATQEHLPITVLPLDVTQDDSVAQAVQQMLAARGRLDVLINNAGIAPLGAVEELPLAAFRQTMDTNYFGALRCIQAVLPHMRAQHSGCIINVSSIAGRIASAGQSAYCASKFALEALSEALAAEVKAHNIRVVLVEPGIIDTPIFEKVGILAADSPYPQARRLNALFAAALQSPVAPFVTFHALRRRAGFHAGSPTIILL